MVLRYSIQFLCSETASEETLSAQAEKPMPSVPFTRIRGIIGAYLGRSGRGDEAKLAGLSSKPEWLDLLPFLHLQRRVAASRKIHKSALLAPNAW